jgi:glycosyltransferase involved in cell wall biosynthesis
MTAAHGGFGSERVPLGGGAAVFERLCQAWSGDPQIRLHAAGAGGHAPPGVAYLRLAPPPAEPSRLGTLAYARFCREFERASTEHALRLRPDVVLAHDISEGPNVASLRQAGIPVATIFHVDVVDIFSRLYLGSLLRPERLAALYRASMGGPWPDLLRLVLAKQQEVMSLGRLNLVPSPGAARLLERCYPEAPSPVEVVGWGAPQLDLSPQAVAERALALRREAGIPDHHAVLLTLSRLSPEKAQHRLLQAVALAEAEGRAPADLTVVIAGAPAFMQGQRHESRLKRLAARLRTRVHFAGHVGGLDRAAWYRTATLFVVCSLHESYGLTTLEAMQQGCPVVAVASFGTEATVSAGCGRLVPAGPELCRRLWGEIALLLDAEGSEIRSRLAQGARQRARELGFAGAAARVRESLQRVVQQRQPSSFLLGP